MTKTPKTDSQAYDVLYRADMGGWFRADEIKKDPYGDHVSADFARQLEEENNNMREAIQYAYDVLQTVESLWPVWMGTPNQTIEHEKQKLALTKLQPFLQ